MSTSAPKVVAPKVIGCIPARYASSRLPGKPLCEIGGKPMIVHVAERARRAERLSEVVVLTDDARIVEAVEAAGMTAVMTPEDCASGTDRIAWFMQNASDGDVFVNIQGDEVTLDPAHIDAMVDDFLRHDEATMGALMGTLAHWSDQAEVMRAPSSVKVVTDNTGRALYFSRHCIPVHQNGALPERVRVHIGVYIYRRETLQKLMRLNRGELEMTEQLEQLRALENGIGILVTTLNDYHGLAVDTPQDLAQARRLFSNKNE